MILFSEARAHSVPDKSYAKFMFEGFVIEVYKKPRRNEYIYSSCNATLWTLISKTERTPEDVETEFLRKCNKCNINKNKLIDFIKTTLDKYIANLKNITEDNISMCDKGIIII